MLEEFLVGLQSNSGLWIDDVRLSVRPSVNIWLTSVFKFVLGHINQYRHYVMLTIAFKLVLSQSSQILLPLCNPAIPSLAVSCNEMFMYLFR